MAYQRRTFCVPKFFPLQKYKKLSKNRFRRCAFWDCVALRFVSSAFFKNVERRRWPLQILFGALVMLPRVFFVEGARYLDGPILGKNSALVHLWTAIAPELVIKHRNVIYSCWCSFVLRLQWCNGSCWAACCRLS